MGNRIKELRLDRGLSQQQLADRIGTTKATISKWEKGQRQLTLEKMYRLADALQCHHVELIDNTAPVSDDENELLKTFRGLSEDERPIALRMFTAMGRPGSGVGSPNDDN